MYSAVGDCWKDSEEGERERESKHQMYIYMHMYKRFLPDFGGAPVFSIGEAKTLEEKWTNH